MRWVSFWSTPTTSWTRSTRTEEEGGRGRARRSEKRRGTTTRPSRGTEDEAAKQDAEGEERHLPETFGELLSQAFAPPVCRDADARSTRVSVSAPIEAQMALELDGPYALRVAESRLEDAYFSEREQLVALRYGEGLVVTLTTAAPFTNRRIHCHDHAWFLWFAVEDRRKVWLLHDPDAPRSL